jgi:hypothetical protein
MGSIRPQSRFGYFPQFSSLKVGSLDDVNTDNVKHNATLRFNSGTESFEARGASGRQSAVIVNDLGNAVYSGEQLLKGVIMRNSAGANYTDVFPSAAEIVGATCNAREGDSFEFCLINTSTEGGFVDLRLSAGVAAFGGVSVAAGHVRRFIVLFNGVTAGNEAVQLVSLGVVEC